MDFSDSALLSFWPDQKLGNKIPVKRLPMRKTLAVHHTGLLRDDLIEHIVYNFSGDIVKCVDLQKLVPHLLQQHLLTKVEEDYLADEREDHSVRIRRHLIPLLVKEGRAGLVGFCTALVSASVEHPGHAILAQKLRQEVVELAKQDTDLFLERSYSEKAAAIDEYCSYDDLLDQSQAVTLHLCKRLKKHITGQLTGGCLQIFAMNLGMSVDVGMKIVEDYMPHEHFDMVVSHFLQGKCKEEATPMRVVLALCSGKGLGRLFCHVSDLWGTAHGSFTELLSKLLVYDWSTLARHLGYTEREINQILDSHEDAGTQVGEFLRMWRIPDCGPHTLNAIWYALLAAKLDSVAESFYREGAILAADMNYDVILAHRAERRERRFLVLPQESHKIQLYSKPTARLATPEVAAWQLPQWQAKLHPWPTRLLEASQDLPAEIITMGSPPAYSGQAPHQITDVQELNDVCDDSIAPLCETEAHKQDGGDSSCSITDEESSEWLLHGNDQHPIPSAACAPSSCTTEETDKEISISHLVPSSSKLEEEPNSTQGRQARQPSESVQYPLAPFLKAETPGIPDSLTIPSVPTAVEEDSKHCSNTQLVSISGIPKESPLLAPEHDDGSKLGSIPKLLDWSVVHGDPLHLSTATDHEQIAHSDVNPLWQCAKEGTLENVTVSANDNESNELNMLSTSDGADEGCSSVSVMMPSSVPDCGSADVEPLYEACLAQLTSEVMLWNSVEFVRFVSDTEQHLVFPAAVSRPKEETARPTELLRALGVQEIDLNFILALMDTSPLSDLVAEDQDGATALYHAATRGLHDVVKALIHKGVDVDCAVKNDALGRTPLLSACASGHLDVVSLLLEHGADPNKIDLLGRNCLLLATVLKNVKALLLLLDHGASVNVRSHTYNTTPLALACLIGAVPAVHILLDRGADPSGFPASETGLSPLTAAVTVGNKELAVILLDKGAFVDPLTPIHYTPLHIACFLRDVELVQLLIARNAMINSKALRCETPLMAAVSSGSVDVVKYLLNQFADVGTSRLLQAESLTIEVSPLGEAALKGQETVFEILMEFDPDVNFAYKGLISVLCLACVGGNVNIVDYLLKTNDINLSIGMSLDLTLVLAMKRGHRACAELILERVELEKIVSYARENSRKQLLEALQPFQACVPPNNEERLASHVEVLDMSASLSSAQMSNDLSDATETDKAQVGFDKQSLTEVPTSKVETEPARAPTTPSVHVPMQLHAEEQIFGMNEKAGRRERRDAHFTLEDLIEGRHEFGLRELLGQLGHSQHEQLSVLQQSAEHRKRLASVIRFLIVAAGDTGDLLTVALDNNYQHICQFLTDYSDGKFDTDAALLDRLKDVDGEPSTLVFIVKRAFSIDSLIHLAQGMDHQLCLQHFRKLKSIMEKERRQGLSLHEILGVTGQSRLVDIVLTAEATDSTVVATAQVVTPKDELHVKARHQPPTAGIPEVTAAATAQTVTLKDSHGKAKHPLPPSVVPEATISAVTQADTPEHGSPLEARRSPPTVELPEVTVAATNQLNTSSDESQMKAGHVLSSAEVQFQGQNNLNPAMPTLNPLDLEEGPPHEHGNVNIIENDLLCSPSVQSAGVTDVPITQVKDQTANVVGDHKAAMHSVLEDNQLFSLEDAGVSLDTGTASTTAPSKNVESFNTELPVNALGPVVSSQLLKDSVHPLPVRTHNHLEIEAKDSPDVSSDARAKCATVPSVRSLDTAYSQDDKSVALPQLVATEDDPLENTPPSATEAQVECHSVVKDQLNAAQSQQDSNFERTFPNTPPDSKSIPEVYRVGNATYRQTIDQKVFPVNAHSHDYGNSEFDIKACMCSMQAQGNSRSRAMDVVIETQNESHKRLLRLVARRVGSCWTILARRLGVSEEEISTIKCHSFTPPERCSALLRKWTGQGPPSRHMWSTLQVALCHIGHCHLVSTISEQISNYSADAISLQQDSTEELGIDLTDVEHSRLLTNVSVIMGSSWRQFCETQGLRRSSCEAICDSDVAFSVLIQWVNRERKPTFESLMVALCESNLGYVSACFNLHMP